ncbi:MAG: hypothetical protein GF317_21185 [Candidatus Lokiarchaeota archaeon]|nr:hypothetical protein [Candidatus Lokiarchaeota archaeon]MBD3201972.1 hypothetical protein [Candidatus Lokiarchaeota archaeon]
MLKITQIQNKMDKDSNKKNLDYYLNRIYNSNLRNLLNKCYQCVRCSGVCQLSKVQKFTPSRIIQKILEGFEKKVLESGVLWDCLMCNSCLQNCPEDINFADVVRIAKWKMLTEYNQDSEGLVAHKGVYTSIAEIMSNLDVSPKRNLDWIPEECEISDKGDVLYHVGCLPFFTFEFDNLERISKSTLEILSECEEDPIVVLENEYCCGHDLYWGQGNLEAFINLAIKNIRNFENSHISTIIVSCAEGYRTFKIDYPKLFDNFSETYDVKHIIEYIYEKWKEGIISFIKPEKMDFPKKITFHDPCRLSRFLSNTNIMDQIRAILNHLTEIGLEFYEMKHNKENSLCCGVSSWTNCNERSKALRYKRLSEANNVASLMLTSCPKCIIHFRCLKDDYEEFSSLEIMDITEMLVNLIKINK